ncbi:hypothetical protein ACVWYG_001276 [Pedobacter sp. UYEF25]
MKKSIITFLFFIFTVSLCTAQKRRVSITKNVNNRVLQINNDAEKMQLKVKGDVTFTDDETAVDKLAPDAEIFYKKNHDKLEITPNESGLPIYTINGTKKTNLETADKILISQCVKTLIDNGVGAKERAVKLFAKGGVPLVLNEVDRHSTDYVQYIYLNFLVEKQPLNNDEMLTFLNKIDKSISSDYYRAELLGGIKENYFKNEIIADAYLENVKNIKSDYYKFKTLNVPLNSSLSDKQVDHVVSLATAMSSDYYKFEALGMLTKRKAISNSLFSKLMSATANIKSDYYKSELISSLLANEQLNSNQYSQTIAATQNINSDFYKASILKKLINPNVKDEKEWSKLIGYVAHISSDYEKSEILIKIASKMPASETLKNQFTEAAKGIGSDFYYGRIMSALK